MHGFTSLYMRLTTVKRSYWYDHNFSIHHQSKYCQKWWEFRGVIYCLGPKYWGIFYFTQYGGKAKKSSGHTEHGISLSPGPITRKNEVNFIQETFRTKKRGTLDRVQIGRGGPRPMFPRFLVWKVSITKLIWYFPRAWILSLKNGKEQTASWHNIIWLTKLSGRYRAGKIAWFSSNHSPVCFVFCFVILI